MVDVAPVRPPRRRRPQRPVLLGSRRADLRWRTAEEDLEGTLFPDEAAVGRHVGTGAFEGTEFLHVNARSVINTVPAASRMPFRHTVNPYRGCSHACTYCFARPTHRYLGLGTGEDFERRIVVKVNAVERLRAELLAPTWSGMPIAMGTNTDPYQPAEGKYHLTSGIIDVLGEVRNPFSVLTKSTLVLRDLEAIARAARRTRVRVDLSIGTLDAEAWRLTEPGTPPPARRIEAVRRLNEAGVPCGVLVAPVIPGLSDDDEQLRAVARACADAGAVSVTTVPLHLRAGVREHYLAWLGDTRPDLLALHHHRFRHGAYQAEAEQRRVSAVVTAAFAEAAGARRPAVAARRPPATGSPSRGTPIGRDAHRPREEAAAPEVPGARSAPGVPGARPAAEVQGARPAAEVQGARPAAVQLSLL